MKVIRNITLGILVGILLACVCPVAALWGYSFAITDLGRLTDFKTLTGTEQITISDTDYSLTITQDKYLVKHIMLVNNNTRQQVDALYGISQQAYTTFEYQNKLYLVLRSFGGGTDSAFDYVVIDISESSPRVIGTQHLCGNPRLNGDHLEFQQFSSKCDMFPFGGTVSTVEMPLN